MAAMWAVMLMTMVFFGAAEAYKFKNYDADGTNGDEGEYQADLQFAINKCTFHHIDETRHS
jgi:hypothetical protein